MKKILLLTLGFAFCVCTGPAILKLFYAYCGNEQRSRCHHVIRHQGSRCGSRKGINQQVGSGKTDSSQPDGQNSERQLETWAPSCELILMSDPAGCVEVESAHEDISNSDRGEFYKIPGLYSKYHSSDNDNLKN